MHPQRLHGPIGDRPVGARCRYIVNTDVDKRENAGDGENGDGEKSDNDRAHQNQLLMPKTNCAAPTPSPLLRAIFAVWPNFPA